MSTPVSAGYLSTYNVLGQVSKSQLSSWNVGKPVQPNMTQMATVPWISTYPS
jgi:hypothetical protein